MKNLKNNHRYSYLYKFYTMLILFLAVILSACGKQIEEHAITGSKSSVVYGASQFAGTASEYQVCESGIVYLSDGLARYYDFEADQKYVLCTRANCRHADDKCPAFAIDDQAIVGLAYFQNIIYMVRRSDLTANYELLQFDLASGSQKVVAAWDIGTYEEGEWVIRRVEHVTYAGSHVWMELVYGYVFINEKGKAEISSERTVVTGVDLTTGDEIRLNEVTDAYERIKYQGISPDFVVLEKRWFEEPMLMKWEFQEQLQQGKYSEFTDLDDAYEAYRIHYEKTVSLRYTGEIYHIPSGTKTEFASGECMKQFQEDGSLGGIGPGYVFNCMTSNLLLYSDFSWDNQDTYTMYGYSFQDKTTRELFTIADGGFLSGGLAADGLLLCCEYIGDDQAQIFYYDVNTDKRTDLFLDARTITFRMIGSTEDSYIGKIYDESFFDQLKGSQDGAMYRILKKDYEAGNLNAAKKLPI